MESTGRQPDGRRGPGVPKSVGQTAFGRPAPPEAMAYRLGTAGERIYWCRACDQSFVIEQPTAARGRAREWPRAACPLCGAADRIAHAPVT